MEFVVGMKPNLEMVSFSFYDFLCAFLCASKFLVSALYAFLSASKFPFLYCLLSYVLQSFYSLHLQAT